MVLEQLPEHLNFPALIKGLYFIRQAPDISVSGLSLDSRLAQSGDLFFALQGQEVHGKTFIDDAITRGVSVVMWESPIAQQDIREGVPVYGVPGLKNMVGAIAERFYGGPSSQQWVIGITGTNGKTSVAQFIAQAIHQKTPCGVIGTLGNGVFGQLNDTVFTTPDAVTLHTLLDDMHHDDVNHVVMEVSSHGLEQGRAAGVSFDVAVFTNLSHEHLDYHGDMESYGQAKRRLFESSGLKYAVINIDDDYGRKLLTSLPASTGTVSYGFGGGDVLPSLLGSELQLGSNGLRMHVESDWGSAYLQVPLIGGFNAENVLAALGALLASGISFDDAVERLGKVSPVPGRMQAYGGKVVGDRVVGNDEHPLVVVDYAHTPDALEKVLTALREHTAGKLWCLFGCGGDRDTTKRPLMAAVAERLADRVIISDDNPRTESPQVIVADILQGFERVDDVLVIADRSKAIESLVLEVQKADVVLIAGKGHEEVQIVGEQRLPFNDGEEVEKALALRESQGGPS
ncbi:MAG: UDP-N-acetylmuramoyl-L-alanyl-D-glutamate--2,6-diaminopimelate ligase [Ectothiorhodospiraceae bacterium]|nr:UDP-N-acetylmuramoyl-L-alanyl-D-glutamate--2,6-diaminopimelate ligase [Ectothiorhodospiraceae bacterium]